MDTRNHAPLTPKNRERMVRAAVELRAVQGRRGASVQYDAEDRRQVDRAVRRRGRGGFVRPLIEAALIAESSDAGRLRGGRGVAPAASYGRADRRRGRRFSGGSASPPFGAGAGRAGPLRERSRARLSAARRV